MHYFIDHSKITSETKAYGSDSANPTKKYNVTTQFQLNGVTKAFACQDSLLMVIQSDASPDLVNVILKPTGGLDIPFGKIKYYIYRGMQKSSFITGTDGITPLDAGNSDFIRDFWLGFNLVKIVKPELTPPFAEALGYMELPLTLDVEKLFSALDVTEVGKNQVNEGMSIGNFSNSCGFEIITENDNYKIDLAYMKKAAHSIDITGMASGTDAEKFILKSEKEKILNYIDPAAFWGMHYEKGVTVHDTTQPLNRKKISKENIYIDILTKYSGKNRVYLDIRSEYGYSYNFYENYADATPAKNNLDFKKKKADPFINKKYEENWPLFFQEAGTGEVSPYSSFFIKLRVNDNLKPLLYFEKKEIIPASAKPSFLNDTELRSGAAIDWTKEIEFKFPNIDSGGNIGYIANYLKAQYFRQQENAASPDTVIKKGALIDKGIRMHNKPLLIELKNNSLDKNAFVSGSNFGFVAENGVFYDNSTALLYLKNKLGFKSSTDQFAKLDLSMEPLKSFPASTLFSRGLVLSKYKIAESALVNVDIINVAGYDKAAAVPKVEDIFFIGLTHDEYDALNQTAGISNLHTKIAVLEEIPNQADINTGLPYKKYALKLLGLNDNGKSASAAPASPINVYGSGSQVLCSKDFAAGINLAYMPPDPINISEHEFAEVWKYNETDPSVLAAVPGGFVEVDDVGNNLAISKPFVYLRGQVYYPVDKKGDADPLMSNPAKTFPLVVIIHGNGQNFSDYADLSELLAKNGFITASISCMINLTIPLTAMAPQTHMGITYDKIFDISGTKYGYSTVSEKVAKLTFPGPVITPMADVKGVDFDISGSKITLKAIPQKHGMAPLARSNLLYPHLKIIKQRFGARLQDNIGLMGHSRGGQAVVKNAQAIGGSSAPANLRQIKGIISLAPTDYSPWGDNMLEENMPYFVLYGSKDGDVSGAKRTGFSLWDRAKHNKSMAFVYGATHNGFITNDHDWTDDGNSPAVLIPLTTQKLIAKSYHNAFFRMALKNEPIWKSLFTGEIKSASILSSSNKGIFFQYQDKAPLRLIDDFEDVPKDWSLISGNGNEEALNPIASSPHDTKALKIEWKANSKLQYLIPSAKKNVTAFSHLSFRITKIVKQLGDLSDLKVELKSGANSYPALVKEFSIIPDPDTRPDDPAKEKSALITIRIPVSKFTANGIDHANLTELNFLFPAAGSGHVHIDSIEFTN